MLFARHARFARCLLAGFAAVVCTTAAALPQQQAGVDPPHQPPVVAPISDAFRPPTQPYGPGNRGLEYTTRPGTVVQASAAGEVVFAGEVAGTRHVTIRHADGVRTSYSFLDVIEVVRGQQVGQGDRLGLAGERLHFGARRGDDYFDPATLFAATATEVELLPFEVPPGESGDEERTALLFLAFGDTGGGFGIDLPSLGDVAGWLGDRAGTLGHYASEVDPGARAGRLAHGVVGRLLAPQDCTWRQPPERPAADGERVALLVGGLGSSSESASIDELRLDELGYDADAVARFSYRGGRTPGSGSGFSQLPPAGYDSADTQGDLRISAARLADAVEAMLAERPDATLDLYAHSMGGVVARLALVELVRRGADLDRLGLVATLGTPHRGADMATAVAAASTSASGRVVLDAAEAALDSGLDPGAPAVQQLAETSDVVAALDRAGVPPGVELVSLAAAGDRVVAAPNTEVAGARNVTVGLRGEGAHGDLVASDAATDELTRALAQVPPACDTVLTSIEEEVLGHGTSYTEDLAGAGVASLPG